MKQWRTCHVDVDSKNKPCLERMMSVVLESSQLRFIPPTSMDDEKSINCTFSEFDVLIGMIDQRWVQALRNRHG